MAGRYRIESNFDSGNGVAVEFPASDDGSIRVSIRLHPDAGTDLRSWFNFRLVAAAPGPLPMGQTFSFELQDFSNHRGLLSADHRPVVRAESSGGKWQPWRRIAAPLSFAPSPTTRSHGTLTMRYAVDAPACSRVQFAYFYPYPHDEVMGALDALDAAFAGLHAQQSTPPLNTSGTARSFSFPRPPPRAAHPENIYYAREVLTLSLRRRPVHLVTLSSNDGVDWDGPRQPRLPGLFPCSVCGSVAEPEPLGLQPPAGDEAGGGGGGAAPTSLRIRAPAGGAGGGGPASAPPGSSREWGGSPSAGSGPTAAGLPRLALASGSETAPAASARGVLRGASRGSSGLDVDPLPLGADPLADAALRATSRRRPPRQQQQQLRIGAPAARGAEPRRRRGSSADDFDDDGGETGRRRGGGGGYGGLPPPPASARSAGGSRGGGGGGSLSSGGSSLPHRLTDAGGLGRDSPAGEGGSPCPAAHSGSGSGGGCSCAGRAPRPHSFGAKPVVFVSARVHPGETPGSFALDGVLALLTDRTDPRAQALRRHFVFLVRAELLRPALRCALVKAPSYLPIADRPGAQPRRRRRGPLPHGHARRQPQPLLQGPVAAGRPDDLRSHGWWWWVGGSTLLGDHPPLPSCTRPSSSTAPAMAAAAACTST